MQTILSDLFRTIEADLGAHAFCMLTLDALKSALSQYRIENRKEFIDQLMNVFELVQHTKPRYAILNDSFFKIIERVQSTKDNEDIGTLLDEIERIKIGYDLELKSLIQVGSEIDVEGKTILIYDHSHTVHNVLKAMHAAGKEFSVLVAEQEIEKTADSIAFLHSNQIPFKVVPSYMLSHVDHTVDMIFLGAVTLQENYHFVMDPGTKSIVSHFHLEEKPIYLFLASSKFSLWKLEKPAQEVYAKAHLKTHHRMTEIEFQQLKFSHDRVSLDLLSYIVTSEGILEPKEAKALFDKKYKKRQAIKKKYF